MGQQPANSPHNGIAEEGNNSKGNHVSPIFRTVPLALLKLLFRHQAVMIAVPITTDQALAGLSTLANLPQLGKLASATP